jgi:hypothetical protein
VNAEVRRKLISEMDAFDGSTARLGHLIANLDTVWNTESWEEKSEFRREWGKLEETYAGALEQQSSRLDEIDDGRVRVVLDRLTGLLPT